jgi:hypothetical protein
LRIDALPVSQRSATSEINQIFDVHRTHHALVEDADVDKEFVERDVLLRVGADQIVVLEAGDGEHRSAIQLCVVESVEQVNASGTGGCETHSQLAGELGVAAGHERSGLFVTHLDETYFLGANAQGFHDAVDAIAR